MIPPRLCAAALAVVFVLLVAGTSFAESLAIDFETYTPGNIHGQDGWSKTGPYDAEIVDATTYGYGAFQTRSLRISNGVTGGSFGDQTFSKPLADEAGESTADNGGLSGGIRQSYFEAQWDFASTVPDAEQPGLSITASPDNGGGARMSWVQMADTPSGLEVNFYDVQGVVGGPPPCFQCANFVFHNLVSGLDRTQPHTIKLTMTFVDGPSNDVVRVFVDGSLLYTGGSWEDYYTLDTESSPTPPRLSRTVDSMLFRAGGTAAPDTTGNGFLIDNFSLSSGPVVQCTTTCYVDAVNGNDASGGASAGDAKKTIQAAVNQVTAGGTVLVLPGTYNESPSLTKSLTLQSTGGRDVTTINLQTGPTYLGSLSVNAPVVTIDGFTIIGFDGSASTLASTNIEVTTNADTVNVLNNRIKVGQIGTASNGDDGFGLVTYYDETVPPVIANVTIEDNVIEPVIAGNGGTRAFYINPGVGDFTFRDNEITGKFSRTATSQAEDSLIEENTVTGDGSSAGLGIWGYPDPDVWGHATFRENTISGVASAITLFDAESVLVEKNLLSGNQRGVRMALIDFTASAIDSSTIVVNRNDLASNTVAGIENGDDNALAGTCNWWGAVDGPSGIGSGSGAAVGASILFTPWLLSSDLDGACVGPTLDVADAAKNMAGLTTFEVPVLFDDMGAAISSVGFALQWNEVCVVFDSVTDSNNDGVPNAVTGIPAGFTVSTQATSAQEVTLLIKPPDGAPPLPVLVDGIVAKLEFNAAACDTPPGTGGVKPVVFSFPTRTTPPLAPSFGNNVGHAVSGTTDGGTVTLAFNRTPTDITLDDDDVDENQPAGTPVGNLCTTDPDGGACTAFTYSFSTVGCPGTGNYAFTLAGNVLKTAGGLNHETNLTYAICVRSTDAYGLYFEKAFTIHVDDVNEAPTDIHLSNTLVDEHATVGTPVGALSTDDVDLPGDSHTYTFCPTPPASSVFIIDGSNLKTNTLLDFEEQSSYNVCIRSTDSGAPGLYVERTFTISVDDANDAPVAVNDPAAPPLIVVGDGVPVAINVLTNDSDPDGDSFVVDSITQGAHGTVADNNTHVSYTAAAHFNGPDSFTYQIRDDGTPSALSNFATVSLQVVANDSRADCNADGRIDAADFPATVLEIFDTDLTIDWWNTFTGAFHGSPRGCDSNASENGLNPASPQPSVTAADIVCTVLVFFGNDDCANGVVSSAAAIATASLSIPAAVAGENGATVAVPVVLDTAGNKVAAATFAVSFDPAAAGINLADLDADGVPDAIDFAVPDGMAKTVLVDADAGSIQIALYSTSLPMARLSDGAVATIHLQLHGESALELSNASLGSDDGSSIPVTVDSGIVPGDIDFTLMLPVLRGR